MKKVLLGLVIALMMTGSGYAKDKELCKKMEYRAYSILRADILSADHLSNQSAANLAALYAAMCKD